MLSFAAVGRIVRALRHPNYGLYTAGSSVSLVGTWVQRVAVGWLAWQLTESAAWLGILAFADLFPTVLIGPFAGAAADRWDRLKALRIGQGVMAAQAAALFLLTWSGLITIWLLLALTLLLGVIVAFNQPTRLALIPTLVPRDDLMAAVAINSVIFNVARFIGPAFAGAAILAGGPALAFAFNALATGIFVAALSRLRLAPEARPAGAARRGILAEIGEGLTYAAGHPGIAPLLALLFLLGLFARPFVELLPGFADAVFQSGAEGLAMMTSTIGLGATLGGLWLAGRDGARSLLPVALGAPLLLAAALAGFVASPSVWVALPMLVVAGLAMVFSGVATQTLLQLAVAPALRGRVMALYGLIFRGSPALGALAMGAAADLVGLRWPLAVGAGVTIAVWLVLWRRRPAIDAGLTPPADAAAQKGH